MGDCYKVYCIDYTARHRTTTLEKSGRVFVPGKDREDSLDFFRVNSLEALENLLGAGYDIESYISTEVKIRGFKITAKSTH